MANATETMSFKNNSSPNEVSAELWQSLKSPRYNDLVRCQMLAQPSDNFLLEPKQEHEATRTGEHAGTSDRDNRDPCNSNGNKNEDEDEDKDEAVFFDSDEDTDLAISSSDAKTCGSSDSGFEGNDNRAVFVADKDKRERGNAKRSWYDQHTGFYLEQL